MGACLTLHKYDNKYNEFNQTNFLAAHFAKRNTKFGGGGKRGRAKIPSPQPPSFLPARASGFVPVARSATISQEFRSKNVRAELYNSTNIKLSDFSPTDSAPPFPA